MNVNTFNAFHSRNYRLFFSGQSASLIGTWMQRTAVYWIVYVQTHSAFMLGLAVFCIQFPSFLFSLLGGAVADRHDRYKVMLTTQIASMVQAIMMTLLVYFTKYNIYEILGLSVLLGFINAFDVPARQSLVHDLVDNKKDLGNAIALNSSMVNLARMIGPALSGIILDKAGAGFCFLLNAISFIAVIISLLRMRLPELKPKIVNQKISDDLIEGMRYLKVTPSIRNLIILLAMSGLLIFPYSTLLPVIAKTTLHGNASTFGYLNSFVGIGAIISAMTIASLKHGTNLRQILIFVYVLMGIGLILFSQSHQIWYAFIVVMLCGMGMLSMVTLINTLLQTTSTPAMRGRVMSYYAMAFFGMMPLGSLLVGSISSKIGTPHTFFLQGIISLVIASIVFFNFKRNSFIHVRSH